MFQDSNVTLMVADMARAIRFYTTVLGLTLKEHYGDHWATVQAPGLTIGLHPPAADGPQPGQAGSMSIGLQVAQLDEAVGLLKQRGVEFTAPTTDDGFVRLAFFTDPDQHPLYLCEVSPASQPTDLSRS